MEWIAESEDSVLYTNMQYNNVTLHNLYGHKVANLQIQICNDFVLTHEMLCQKSFPKVSH